MENKEKRERNMDYRFNFFAAGFIDSIHTWLQKKDRAPEQMAKFLLEMLVQLRSWMIVKRVIAQ